MNIRYRNIKRDSEGIITSGSAALVENTYQANIHGNRLQNHTHQKVVERLGRVVWMEEGNKGCGIFDSPSRGLVFYNLKTDEFHSVLPTDPRLRGSTYQARPERIHTSFGNTYLFLSEMENTPFMDILRKAFPDREFYQRVVAHITHDCLKNGSSIKCGEFLSENWLSYLLTDIAPSTLDCDSYYFKRLSEDDLKTAFFKTLILEMRKLIPDFGIACYVDSTPLPGEAENNPFNALCSHGTDGAVIQSRLVLVLDIQTSIPVWFEVIPSNVLDKSTLISITRDVKVTLDIDVEMYDLDAGYARKELFEMFNRNNSFIIGDDGVEHSHTVLVRMPATNGYPRDELYMQCKPHFYSGRYSFDYEHHTFFGERVEIELFGYPEYAFVFIDKTQAESLLRGWREEHLEEWEALSDSAQEWYQVKDGFFVLVGNQDQSPKEALIEYRGRAHIEVFFRDGKAYLRILPLGKWNKQTVKGKIFHDIMETIFYRAYRKQVAPVGMSMSSLIVCMDSLECFRLSENLLELKVPRTQVRELFETLGYSVPGHMDLHALRDELFDGTPMTREPVTVRSKRASGPNPPISPEEKLKAKEQERMEREEAEARRRWERICEKADKAFDKAVKTAEKQLTKAVGKAEKELQRKTEAAKRESTKAKAKAAYDEAIAKAQEAYDQTVLAAQKARDEAKKQAHDVSEPG